MEFLDKHFNLIGALISDEVDAMEGLKEFVEPFYYDGIDDAIENVANNLFKESNGALSREEALKRAQFLVLNSPNE